MSGSRAGRGVCICGPAEDPKQQLLKSKKGIFGAPGAKLANNTSHKTDYPPPPKSMYTGISANVGLKERVEGVAAAADPSQLGLGKFGSQTSYGLANPWHDKDKYTDRVKPDPAAKKSKLKMDKGHAGYKTSYQDWGNKDAELGISSKADAIKGPEQTIVGAIGYGLDGETMYHSTFKLPEGEPGYERSKIVSKKEVEGVPEAKVIPYGALCKSLVHESFQNPGKEAYMRPRTSMKPTRPAADLGHLGLGPEHSQTQYSMAFIQHSNDDYMKGHRPATGGNDPKQLLLKSKKGIFGAPGAKLANNTSHKTDYPPPPKSMYTGISANVGLKERVEGVAAAADPSQLGLGKFGSQTTSGLALPWHDKDKYTDRVKPDPAAKKSKLKMDKGHAGYKTSYQDWGNKDAELGISSKADAIKGPEQTIVGAIGYGLDGETMYHSTFKLPEGEPGYERSKIVTKEEVEGVPEAKVIPYGALCKSLVHESFQNPGKEAYMRPRTSMKPTRPAADLGHLGLGHFGQTTYNRDFVNKLNPTVICRVCALPFDEHHKPHN